MLLLLHRRDASRVRRRRGGRNTGGSRLLRLLWTEQLRQNFVARAHGVDAAVDHGEHLVDAGERARPMRHHDHDAAARAHAQDRLRQRLVAVGIEIGIRLVQHDQERIAIERARQRDALALAGRKHGAGFADLGVVAFRQPHDHVVHAGGLRRRDHRLGRRVGLEARDVLRHRAGEQLDVLRQIADVRAELGRCPLVECRAVETHLAAHRGPDADDHACERGLARGARPDDAQPLTRPSGRS